MAEKKSTKKLKVSAEKVAGKKAGVPPPRKGQSVLLTATGACAY